MKDLQVITDLLTSNTQNSLYFNSDTILVNNTSTVPLRVDKLILQLSCYTGATLPVYYGAVVHITDKSGTSMTTNLSSGTSTLANLNTLMGKWRDNIFLTDFQIIGTGSDENQITLIELNADTQRKLQPNQKMLLTIFVVPLAPTESKTTNTLIDSIVWYSPAAQ